ncbi:hypothetical protein CONCODRAFT_11175 [Conidiobolus coronatus NRRL 28638]|uniref:F-box domain-containing protein n=1 Tax=Conidiobolus coronatus (strain ATCC 28846 / CBS 209.66 / NRRL 28638) TaxID=796925 RepID=A0A137NVU7_CONC2|nr:hypothetical protein CONCODRAFT_11175 [Conidiobolus coronatus NRRL 28638]|eukprot:KXN66887.1 hypothetical protein CONCODRAFT_11175 [Conidiobolus coronatus NRRL 28638]
MSRNSQSKEDSPIKLGVNQKSVNIKKTRKVLEHSGESIKRNGIWNIDSILSNIFGYTDRKNLIEFNTVCKKWNYLTTPVIHSAMKLQRSAAIKNKVHGKSIKKAAKVDLEVAECIKNNSKHAKFLKEFEFNRKLEPQRAIEFFEAFNFITKLTIDRLKMGQDQFLGMIHPLNYLEELNLSRLTIKWINSIKFYTYDVKLPSTLKKLGLEAINLTGNPQLFSQVINSHSNLVEFKSKMHNETNFLKPFLKNYPSLKVFEYENQKLGNLLDIINIFESNPQLLALKLEINLWNKYLSLIYSSAYQVEDPVIYLKLRKSTNIKKLAISCRNLNERSLDSILQNCPQLKDLDIKIPFVWKDWMHLIAKRCVKLEHLKVSMTVILSGIDPERKLQEMFQRDILINNHSAYTNTITSLTLDQFDFHFAKAEYFNSFTKLKSINFSRQQYTNSYAFCPKIEFNEELWPNYSINIRKRNSDIDVELTRLKY